MNKLFTLLLVIVITLTASAQDSIYGFTVSGEDDVQVSLDKYRGKVLLIVNTATKCGFTPQYKELQKLYDDYKDDGLVILDFPCNQFGSQAPGSYEEIHNFCTEHFATTFPQFQKIDVNGDSASPLFAFLKEKQGFKGFGTSDRGKFMDKMLKKKDAGYAQKSDIKWNFTKFLVDGKGNVVARFEPTDSMESLEEAVKETLKKLPNN